MFACVRYVKDNVSLTVPLKNIKQFNPENLQSDPLKKFKVKYTDGAYYKAYIVSIGDSIEEAEAKATQKRFKLPARRFMPETTTDCSSTDEAESFESTINKNKKEGMKQKLQKMAISNYFLANKKDEIENNNTEKNHSLEVQRLREKLSCLEEENKNLRALNIALQQEIIQKFKEPKASGNVEVEMAVGGRKNGNVYIGRGEWMPAVAFDNAMRKKKNSIFVKELAKSIFGEETLRNSSLCGNSSNKNKASLKRPALNSTKLLAIKDVIKLRARESNMTNEEESYLLQSMDRLINEKIQDLRRPQRVPKKVNTNVEEGKENNPIEKENNSNEQDTSNNDVEDNSNDENNSSHEQDNTDIGNSSNDEENNLQQRE